MENGMESVKHPDPGFSLMSCRVRTLHRMVDCPSTVHAENLPADGFE